MLLKLRLWGMGRFSASFASLGKRVSAGIAQRHRIPRPAEAASVDDDHAAV